MDSDHHEHKKNNFWKELFKLVLISLFIVVPFRLFIAQPFIVDGASMDPTFKNGDYLIVDELTYHFKEPARGSVLIFRYPRDPSKYFIKRIIGLPGERVEINAGKVTIYKKGDASGTPLNEPYVEFTKADTATYVLSEDQYFVLGDNRAGSADSRYWGPVPGKNIIGRPILRVYPLGIWPGDKTEVITQRE